MPVLDAPTALDGYRRIHVGEEFVFPRDHGTHPDTKTEWWYLTGNFEDEHGDPFGLQFTIFRSALGAPGCPTRSRDRAREPDREARLRRRRLDPVLAQ